ncbi:MAG: HEAT repeat domain-containing protein [Leptospirales bacterium]
MRKLSILAIIFILFAGVYCAAPQIKDGESLEKAKEKALEGDEKSVEAMGNALEKDPPEKDPDLHENIIDELGDVNTEQSREILMEQANSEDEANREAAISSLHKHSDDTEDEGAKSDIEYTILNEVDENYEEYGEVTAKEIEVLGEIQDYRSLDTLNSVLYEQPEDAEIILHSIAQQITVEENADEHSLEISREAESILTEYIVSDAPLEKKEQAVTELYKSARQTSQAKAEEKMMILYEHPELKPEDKEIVLKVLGSESPEFAKKWDKKLKGDYVKAKTRTQRSKIESTYAAIQGITLKAARIELGKLLLPKGPVISIPRARKLRKLPPKTATYEILKKYEFTEAQVDHMENALLEVVKESDSTHKPISKIVFAGLQKLHPEKNYFELKKIAAEGFSHRGLIYAVLETIHTSYETEEMRAIAARKLFNIDMEKAEALVRAYKKERGYFRYISR